MKEDSELQGEDFQDLQRLLYKSWEEQPIRTKRKRAEAEEVAKAGVTIRAPAKRHLPPHEVALTQSYGLDRINEEIKHVASLHKTDPDNDQKRVEEIKKRNSNMGYILHLSQADF